MTRIVRDIECHSQTAEILITYIDRRETTSWMPHMYYSLACTVVIVISFLVASIFWLLTQVDKITRGILQNRFVYVTNWNADIGKRSYNGQINSTVRKGLI